MTRLPIDLSADEKLMLVAVYGHFKESGTWIGCRTLQMKFGKTRVELLEKRQEPRLIFRYSEAGKEVYKWTLAGFLLSENGEDDVTLLCRYLEFMKQQLHANPEFEELSSTEVEENLKLDRSTSTRLVKIISETGCWSGGYHSESEGTWKARPPIDVMDLVESATVLEFLENRIKREIRSDAHPVEMQKSALNTPSLPIAGRGLGSGANSDHTHSDSFLPLELVRNARDYIKVIAEQCCGCYERKYYDATAVLARRLLETLILETFEAHGIHDRIKNPDGSFFSLGRLIQALLNESTWNLSRGVKKALPHLKDLGDQSAHNRRYLAKKADLDNIKREFRITVEELLHLGRLIR